MSLDNILNVLPYIRLRNDVWKFTRSIEKEPFLVCCFAAWLHFYGTIPADKESLLSSEEMNDVLKSKKKIIFIGNFGNTNVIVYF